MINTNKDKAPFNFKPYKSYVFLLVSISVTLILSFYIFLEIKQLFKESLQQRVLAIVQTAALSFDPKELDQITGKSSIETAVYKKITLKLQEIRMQNASLKFIDIYRKTPDPTLFEYVSDADSIHPDIPIDINGDGVIDDEDALNFPGDIYDGSNVPNFIENAFIKPDVDPDVESSQWGVTLDASAPIFGDRADTNYVLNVDVDVTEFIRHTNLAFLPFAFFVLMLIIVLTMLTLSLVKMWGSQVEFFKEIDLQKDELLGLVSHQLATPVSAIKWNTEMMLDGDLGEFNIEQRKTLVLFQDITKELSDLISMILDVSRIQLGRIRVDKQSLDLNVFFKEILDIIKPKVAEKKVKFIVDIPKKIPTVMLDKRYTHMTIENLLTNAVKYTPTKGQVSLTVSVKKNILRCEVKDTGVGIPKSEQAKIFGKLFRASNVKNTVDGNGFGLFVAKGAIEAQGGKIWFTSEEGKGSTFFIELPLQLRKSDKDNRSY